MTVITNQLKINGVINPGFSKVEKAFSENFSKRREIGASLCVYHKNKWVIDIWAGYKDLHQKKLWTEDTIVPVFSTSKAIAASCLAICHCRGL